MTPTAAARQSSTTTPSLRDRLKDPSLLRDRCYVDGVWTGTPANPVTNPVNGVELGKVPKFGTAEATLAVEAAERAFPDWAKLTAKAPDPAHVYIVSNDGVPQELQDIA